VIPNSSLFMGIDVQSSKETRPVYFLAEDE